MGLKFNPLTGRLDLVNNQTATTGDVYNINNLQVDQSGGTSDTYGSLAGTINSLNTTFTVSNAAYATGTLIVSLNGQVLTQGTGEDWVETSAGSGTFDFNTAPETGDEITASYMTAVASTIGGVTHNYVAKTGAYTVGATDYYIDCTANTFTLTLPTASGTPGKTFVIKNSGTGTITVDADGTETIDGDITAVLASQYESINIVSDGTNWIIT